jgi:UDP-N-acetylglucosamine acyltransferase
MPIHPTAVIDPRAQIDSSVEIGPYTIIGPEVRIGPRTRIMAHVAITGQTTIGADNDIHTGAVIGDAPQHLAYKGAPTCTVIGDRNTIREYVSIHGSYLDGSRTIIGNDNYLMVSSHVGHDCVVGNRIVMCNGSMLGGHVEVEDQVFISGLVAIHQFTRIGRLVMCAGVCRITRDVPPFMMAYGDSEVIGLNAVGLRRAGIGSSAHAEIKQAYRILYQQRRSLSSAIAVLKSEPRCPEVQHIIEFLEQSKRGICGGRRSERGGEASTET